MKLTELRRSSSRNGGWLFKISPKRDAKKALRGIPAIKFMERYDVWYSPDRSLKLLASFVDNFREMADKVGYLPPHQTPPPPRETLSPFGAMYLRDNAPDEVVDAAYRALAKLRHPDYACDDDDRQQRTEAMKRLNTAYEACKKARGRT